MDITNTHTPRAARRVAVALVALALTMTACSSSGVGSDIPGHQSSPATSAGATPNDLTTASYATTAEVLAAVAAAQQTQALPDGAAKQLVELSQGMDKGGPDHCFDKKDTNVSTENTIFGECAYGDPNGTKQMVIYGDSRAPMWASTLERVAAISGWQLRVFAKGGCPGADLQFQNLETGVPDTDCDIFHTAAVEEIRTLHPQLVVTTSQVGNKLASGEAPSPAQWQDAWVATFHRLAQPGTQLAMIGSIPNLENGDAKCLAAHSRDIQQCSTERAKAISPFFESERAAAAAAGVHYVDTVPWVCAETCQPVIADKVVYYDPYHFTKWYMDYLPGALAEALKPVMG